MMLLAVMMTTVVFAQSGEGTLVMEITDASSDNPQVAPFADGMKGSQTLVYFKDGQTLTKVNMMGGMIKVDVHNDKEKNMDLLMDAMGNKIWVSSTKLEQDKMKAGVDNPLEYMEITYDESDTKSIAGFDCYKMVVEFPDAEGYAIEGYVTEQIEVRPNIIQNVDISELKGFPLEFDFTNPQMNITMSALSYGETVDQSVFEKNTAGYQKMTMEEFAELQRQFGM